MTWTGKVNGVTNPAKVNGIDVAGISKINGVATAGGGGGGSTFPLSIPITF